MNKYLLIAILFLPALTDAQKNDQLSSYSCITIPDTIDNNEVFLFIDSMPTFPGGDTKLNEFILKNLKLSDNDYQYTFHISFIIDSVGRIRNPCFYKKENPNELTNSERTLMDLINRMPQWNPGIKEGQRVYTRLFFPIIIERQ